MVALNECLGQVEIGKPIEYRNLCIIPISGEAKAAMVYLLAADAMTNRLLTVTETSEAGSVPELLVTNLAEEMVLLLDGEELIGAKQNRIVNTTVLLKAKSKTKVRVSCVERGRWRHVSKDFSTGSYAPAGMRAAKSRSVTENLQKSGVAHADQGQVWESVAEYCDQTNIHSSTEAMHDIYDKKQTDIQSFLSQFVYPQGTRGCIVAINGAFTAFDMFDKAATAEKLWRRLLMGYVLDAIVQNAGDSHFSQEQAQTIFSQIAVQECIACPSVGLGDDWRFNSQTMSGSALVFDGSGIHICAFANGGDRHAVEDVSGISSPSRRRSHRRDEPIM